MAQPAEYTPRVLTPEEEAALLAAGAGAGLGYGGPAPVAAPPPAAAPPPETYVDYTVNTGGESGGTGTYTPPAPTYVAAPPADGASQYYGGTTGGGAGSTYSNPNLVTTTYPASGSPAIGIRDIPSGATGQALRYDDTSMYSAAPLPASTTPVGSGSRTQTNPGALTPTMDWASGIGATIDSLFPSAGAASSRPTRQPASDIRTLPAEPPGDYAPGGKRYQARPGALNPTPPGEDFLKGEFGRLIGLDPDNPNTDMYAQAVNNFDALLGNVASPIVRGAIAPFNLAGRAGEGLRNWINAAPTIPGPDPVPAPNVWGMAEDLLGGQGVHLRNIQAGGQEYITDPLKVRETADRAGAWLENSDTNVVNAVNDSMDRFNQAGRTLTEDFLADKQSPHWTRPIDPADYPDWIAQEGPLPAGPGPTTIAGNAGVGVGDALGDWLFAPEETTPPRKGTSGQTIKQRAADAAVTGRDWSLDEARELVANPNTPELVKKQAQKFITGQQVLAGEQIAKQAGGLPPIDLSGLNLGGVSLPADRVANAAYRAAPPPNAPMPAPPPAQAPGQAPMPAPPPASAPGNTPLPAPPPTQAPGSARMPAPPPASAPGNAPMPAPPPATARGIPNYAIPTPDGAAPREGYLPAPPPATRRTPDRNAPMPAAPPVQAPGNASMPAPPPASGPGSERMPPPPPTSAPGNAPIPPPPPTDPVLRIQPTVTEQVANVPAPYQLLPLVLPNVDDFQELTWQDKARIAAQRGVGAIQDVAQTAADANDAILRQVAPDLYAPQPPVDQRVGSTTVPVPPSLRDRAVGGWDAIRGVPSAVGATTWEDVQRLAGRATEGAVGAVNTLNTNSADNVIFGQDLTEPIEGAQQVVEEIKGRGRGVTGGRLPMTEPSTGSPIGEPTSDIRRAAPTGAQLAAMSSDQIEAMLATPQGLSAVTWDKDPTVPGAVAYGSDGTPLGHSDGTNFIGAGKDVSMPDFEARVAAAGGTVTPGGAGTQTATPAQGSAPQPTQSAPRTTSTTQAPSSSPSRQSSPQSAPSSGGMRSSSRQRGGSMDDMFGEDDDFGLNERDFTEKDYDGDGKISSKDRSIGRKRYQSELAKRRKKRGKSSTSVSNVPTREDTPIRRKVLSAIDASVNKSKTR